MLLKIAFTLESFSTNITNMESFRWFLYEMDGYDNSTIANVVVFLQNTKPVRNYNEIMMLPDDEAFCGYVSGKH